MTTESKPTNCKYIEGLENLSKLNAKAVRREYHRSLELGKFAEDKMLREDKKTGKDINFIVSFGMYLENEDVVRCQLRWGEGEGDFFFLDLSMSDYNQLPTVEDYQRKEGKSNE